MRARVDITLPSERWPKRTGAVASLRPGNTLSRIGVLCSVMTSCADPLDSPPVCDSLAVRSRAVRSCYDRDHRALRVRAARPGRRTTDAPVAGLSFVLPCR